MMKIISCPSQNFDERAGGQSPSMVIIHYTGTRTADEAKDRFCDPAPSDSIGRISPHYLIGAEGEIYHFVDEQKRAWHAGRAAWGDVTDINSASIGIEIWNTGHEFDFEEFLPIQIQALIGLIHDIRARWLIPDRNILGHSDVAPGRKLDPGEKFPWRALNDAGIGLMPNRPLAGQGALTADEAKDFYTGLQDYGYRYTDDQNVLLKEFRRHFLPELLEVSGSTQSDRQALFDISGKIIT